MDMEEQAESRTATPSDSIDQTERNETSGSAVGGAKHNAEKGGQNIPRPSGMALSRLRRVISTRKKPVLIGLLGLVGIAVGLSRTFSLNGVFGFRPHSSVSDSGAELRDHSFEEALAPFFIPLPSTSSERVAIIDFSVIWDGLASVRFKRKELQIRDSLYRFILERAKEGEDLQQKAPILEAEMRRTFQESMGSKEIEIRIKKVKVL